MGHVSLQLLRLYLVTTITWRLHNPLLLLNVNQKESGWNLLTKHCSFRHWELVDRYKLLYCFVRRKTLPVPISDLSLHALHNLKTDRGRNFVPHPHPLQSFQAVKTFMNVGTRFCICIRKTCVSDLGWIIDYPDRDVHDFPNVSRLMQRLKKKNFLQATSLFLIRNHLQILIKARIKYVPEDTSLNISTIK